MLLNILFLSCLLLQAGFALECYKCNGCESASRLQETCRNIDPETQRSSCITHIIRTGGTVDSMTIKKCAIYPRNENFICPDLPSGDTVYCNVCQADFCNTGAKIQHFLTIKLWICILLAFKLL